MCEQSCIFSIAVDLIPWMSTFVASVLSRRPPSRQPARSSHRGSEWRLQCMVSESASLAAWSRPPQGSLAAGLTRAAQPIARQKRRTDEPAAGSRAGSSALRQARPRGVGHRALRLAAAVGSSPVLLPRHVRDGDAAVPRDAVPRAAARHPVAARVRILCAGDSRGLQGSGLAWYDTTAESRLQTRHSYRPVVLCVVPEVTRRMLLAR